MTKPLLYTISCPACEVLKTKLNDRNIEYDVCEDKKTMLSLGITTVPVLKIDEKMLCYQEAVQWIDGEYLENN